jgi:dTDP-4-amino-4,6-dideoxygalactose transaminase
MGGEELRFVHEAFESNWIAPLALEAENIESRPVWKPMHLQPVFKGCGCIGGEVATDLFSRGLCLPSGTAMKEEDLGRVVEVIRAIGHR